MFRIFGILLVVVISLSAQDANSYLRNIITKFESISNFKADFSQVASSGIGENFSVSGEITYATKNKFVVSFSGQEIYCNGETVWNYNEKQKRVVINTFEEQFSTFTIDRFLYDLPKDSKLKFVENEDGLSGISLVPQNDSQFREIVIRTDAAFVIKKITLVDQGGATYNITLENITYNLPLSEDYFNYSPIEGIKVIDFR
ncbi:MAG: hypothetical protein SCALA702_29620 [Melioribacteraceae bacterium]|nr:MAG: hypothetical protein SCALA702_29620 [Melioribacteraceae bacterium]